MLKSRIKNHKAIISNTFYLSIIQAIKLFSPFLALPYILKTIGADKFGEIVFAQSVAAFSFILINFGLDVSAVKDISQNRNDKVELSRIVSSVLSVKLILFTLTLALYTAIVFVVPKFYNNYILFLIVFGTAIPEVIFPVWYFQGIEKMKLLTITSFLSIAFYLSTLFIFVKDQDDYLYVPMLQVGGLILSSFVGLIILLGVEKIKLIKPAKAELVKTFKDSIPFFTSRVSVVINQNIAKVVSGFFLGMTEVAAFELAQKIISAALIPFSMLNQAIFPHNANKKNVVFARKIGYFMIALAVIMSIITYVGAPFAVKFFAGDSGIIQLSTETTRLLIGYLFFGSLVLYYGSPTLIAWGYVRPFNVSVYISTITLLVLYGILYLLGLLRIEFFALSLMIVEMVISGYRYYFCRKYKIL